MLTFILPGIYLTIVIFSVYFAVEIIARFAEYIQYKSWQKELNNQACSKLSKTRMSFLNDSVHNKSNDHFQIELTSQYLSIMCTTYSFIRTAKFWMNKPDYLQIGCEVRTFKEWDIFFDSMSTEVIETPRNTKHWKKTKRMYLHFKKYLITNNHIKQ